jgi:hypothetical protein
LSRRNVVFFAWKHHRNCPHQQTFTTPTPPPTRGQYQGCNLAGLENSKEGDSNYTSKKENGALAGRVQRPTKLSPLPTSNQRTRPSYRPNNPCQPTAIGRSHQSLPRPNATRKNPPKATGCTPEPDKTPCISNNVDIARGS